MLEGKNHRCAFVDNAVSHYASWMYAKYEIVLAPNLTRSVQSLCCMLTMKWDSTVFFRSIINTGFPCMISLSFNIRIRFFRCVQNRNGFLVRKKLQLIYMLISNGHIISFNSWICYLFIYFTNNFVIWLALGNASSCTRTNYFKANLLNKISGY